MSPIWHEQRSHRPLTYTRNVFLRFPGRKHTENAQNSCMCVTMHIAWWWSLGGGGGGYQFPCSPEINGLCPLFPKTKILIFYVPCSPKLPLFPCSPSFLDLCSPENMPSSPCSPKPLGGPRWFRTDVPRTMGPYGPPSPPQVLWLWNHADRSIMRENAYLSQFYFSRCILIEHVDIIKPSIFSKGPLP